MNCPFSFAGSCTGLSIISADATAPMHLNLPPKMKRRGRPRNAEKTTAITLPRKTTSCTKFEAQPIFEKEHRILGWLRIEEQLVQSARRNERKLQEEDVELRPELVLNAIIDEKVDLNLVRYLFSTDAWAAVLQVVQMKKLIKDLPYFCGCCKSQLISDSVQCESCLDWSHVRCVPKFSSKRTWFCNKCKTLVH